MGFDTKLTRRQALTSGVVAAVGASLPFRALAAEQQAGKEITLDQVKAAEGVAGIALTDDQRKAVLEGIKQSTKSLENVRALKLANAVAPPTAFVPYGKQPKPGNRITVRAAKQDAKRPHNEEDLAFMTAAELSHLLRTKQVKSIELTELFLRRLKRYGPKLHCVVSLTENLAIEQANKADSEIAAGKWRGHLHGVPYGIKDLFAAKGYKTTWGAEPFKDQVIDEDAAVVERLREAGAVLCAKFSLGALAMADQWFEGLTRNPWKVDQGSSGSSAGSASAMAAGLVAFTIGTETLGSIVSPSQRCRTTGLRPTFGRVSRHGAMALSWTMDKAGPICRTAEDCALVLSEILGKDERDISTVDRPFEYRHDLDVSKLKIGYLKTGALDEDDASDDIAPTINLLRRFGAQPKAVQITPMMNGIDELLSVEAAAAFHEITRDGRVDTIQNSFWPTIFRTSHFTTGVDYVQAMRARTLLMRQFEEELGDLDVLVTPERGGFTLYITNLTGHPQLFVPMGTNGDGKPLGVSLVGRLYDEGTLCAVGMKIQNSTNVYRSRPDLSKL